MKRSQWFVLAFCFMFLGVFFISLDLGNGYLYNAMGDLSETGNICLDMGLMDIETSQHMLDKREAGEITQEELNDYFLRDYQIDESELHCMIRGEIYAPFIWLSYGLFIIFLIMGIMEPKKKH